MENIKLKETRVSPTKLKLEFEIPVENVKTQAETVLREIQKFAQIKGFRQGKVPENIIKERFSSTIRRKTIEKLTTETLNSTIKDKKIDVIGTPIIEKFEFEFDKPFTYIAVVEHQPEIIAKNYKGMKLRKEIKRITEKDLQDNLQKLQAYNTRLVESKSNIATENCCVIVDYTVWLVDQNNELRELKELNAENQLVDLSEKQLYDGLSEGLLKSTPGDYREILTKLPAEISIGEFKQYSGKEVLLKVKIKSIKEKQIPELNDEFAKDLKYSSLDELKSKLRVELEKEAERQAEEKLKKQITDILITSNPVEIPEVLLNAYTNNIYNSTINQLKLQGFTEQDIAEQKLVLEQTARAEAERQLKLMYIFNSIAKQENIEVTKEEIIQYQEELKKQNPGKEKFVEEYVKNQFVNLISDLKSDKIYNWLKTNAKIKVTYI